MPSIYSSARTDDGLLESDPLGTAAGAHPVIDPPQADVELDVLFTPYGVAALCWTRYCAGSSIRRAHGSTTRGDDGGGEGYNAPQPGPERAGPRYAAVAPASILGLSGDPFSAATRSPVSTRPPIWRKRGTRKSRLETKTENEARSALLARLW